jgi:hypothetical protein
MVHIDAVARAVQCPRCSAWCLLGQVDGFKVAVSAQPLTLEGYRAALLAGLGVYRLYGFKRRERLRRVRVDDPQGVTRYLVHPCQSWASTTLTAPQRAAQGFCKVRPGPGCAEVEGVVSCGRCDPPPFDESGAEELFRTLLGAKVIEVIQHG